MKFSKILLTKLTHIQNQLTLLNLKIACAESCTGGLLSALFTENSGSSNFFERGFVTYSNQSKNEILSVEMDLINNFGAVSFEVAQAMAQGALQNSRADIAIAITGFIDLIDKDYNQKSGVVFICIRSKNYIKITKFEVKKHRNKNREICLRKTLEILQDFIKDQYLI